MNTEAAKNFITVNQKIINGQENPEIKMEPVL